MHHTTARSNGASTPTVVTLGETMIMLAPPGHELMEHTETFRALIGGAEANVAVGLARLGLTAGWIGKLPRNALGRWVVNGTRRYGVDTSAVVWADAGRVGTFFVEFGAKPRPTKTIYDRAGSAATTLIADELDWDYIAQAEWLHMTGITPALSETCRRSTVDILRRAGDVGVKVSFDLNYRSALWSPEEARASWHDVLAYVDLIIATEADAAILLDAELEREAALRRISEAYTPDAVVMTCGGAGSMAFDGESVLHMRSWPLELVNRLGAGDAFVAGLLYGLIEADLETGLAYGNAMSALKFTIPQNLPLIDREDVERLLSGSDLRLVR
ncbi:MAG: PfkB family carbohydrate kinase [Anaerolineae bacterium]